MGFFGTYRFADGSWSVVDPDGSPVGPEPWLWVNIHDSDFATIQYGPAGSGTGVAYLNDTPRTYFDDPGASAPTDPDREAAGLAQWRMAVSGAAAIHVSDQQAALVGLLAVDDGPEIADDADDADDVDVFAELKAVQLLTALALPLPPELVEPA